MYSLSILFYLIHLLKIRQYKSLIEIGLQRCIKPEDDKPAISTHRLHVVALVSLRRFGSDIQINGAVFIPLDVRHPAVDGHRTYLWIWGTVVIMTPGILAVQIHRPELGSRNI